MVQHSFAYHDGRLSIGLCLPQGDAHSASQASKPLALIESAFADRQFPATYSDAVSLSDSESAERDAVATWVEWMAAAAPGAVFDHTFDKVREASCLLKTHASQANP